MPQRIRLSRRRGYRKPAGAIVVARPSRFGNPFPANGDIPAAVARYREWIAGRLDTGRLDTGRLDTGRLDTGRLDPGRLDIGRAPPTEDEIRAALRGHDLACWCPLDGPCHADVLLEIANRA